MELILKKWANLKPKNQVEHQVEQRIAAKDLHDANDYPDLHDANDYSDLHDANDYPDLHDANDYSDLHDAKQLINNIN